MTQVKQASRDAAGKSGKAKTIAIVGATGAVGGEMLKCVERSRMNTGKVRVFASERSAGRRLPFRGGEVELEVLSDNAFEGVDVALFASESDISKKYVPIAVGGGRRTPSTTRRRSAWTRRCRWWLPEVNGDADHAGARRSDRQPQLRGGDHR